MQGQPTTVYFSVNDPTGGCARTAAIRITYIDPCAPGTKTWTGTTSTDWNTASNWNPACVPSATSDVVIANTTNQPTIGAGTLAVAKTVVVNASAALTVAATGSLTINGSTTFGSYTTALGNDGTVTNNGSINIGSTTSVGNYGIYNKATFNNNAGGQINIDRSTLVGLNNDAGTFTNAATITIGANASVGEIGLHNKASFNNNTGGQITIDRSTLYGLANGGGTFTNAATITIGANASVGNYGINNQSTFNNNAGGQINIDRSTNAGLIYNYFGTFNNAASITIGANASVGNYGIYNTETFGQYNFNNNAGGQINIDRSTVAGLYLSGRTFTNAATITIGANASVGNYGIYNKSTFNNNAGGQINIDRSTTYGLYHNAGTFTNAAGITIGANASVGTYGLYNSATFNNNACAVLSTTAPLFNSSGKTITNAGWFTLNTASAHSNAGTVTNNGILSYPQGNPIPGTVTNNKIIVQPKSGSCSFSSTLTLGATTGFTIGTTWYLNADLSGEAGTYDRTTNTFTPTNLPLNTTTTVYFTAMDNTSGCTRTVSIKITTGASVWTGATDTDWYTASNWLSACVPTATEDVVINSSANQPTIGAGAAAVAKSVVVNAGAVLTVAATGSLTINGSTAFGSYTTALGNNGTVTNNGTISIGSTSSVGYFGIVNQAMFNNNAGGQINIDNSTTSGLYNFDGTFTNAANITIGANASVGLYGLANQATFNNSAGGQINVDNSTYTGLFNAAGGTFTNAAGISIGAYASVGDKGLANQATFNNNTGGQISIDRSTTSGLYNFDGTFTNAATITIGANERVGTYGFWNEASFNNTCHSVGNCGQININRSTTSGLYNFGGTLTNAANITIGANASVGTYGLYNNSTFTNSTSGQINIDRSTVSGLNNTGGFGNNGTISIGANASVGSFGLENHQTFANNACGTISTNAPLSNASGLTITNAGLLTVNTALAHANSGTIPNNGIISYPQGNPIPNVMNNEIIADPISGTGDISPALSLGTTVDFTIATTWYLNSNLTGEAGTYNQATNTFSATGLTSDVPTTVYFSANAAGGCALTASIKITWTRPCTAPTVYAMTGGGAYCAGGAGVAVGLSGSENGITYQLQKDGVNDGAAVNGDGMALDFGLKTAAGTYTVVATRTSDGCTATTTDNATVSVSVAPAITSAANGNSPVCPGTALSLSVGASGTAPLSYAWSGTGAFSSAAIANPTVTGAATGDYVVVVSNACGSATSTATVAVEDVQPPTVTCPANTTTINTNAGAACQITVPNYVAMLSPADNCTASGDITEAQSIPSGAYGVSGEGATVMVHYTATDGATPPNTTTCTVVITVNDDDAPTLTCPANTTVAADASCQGAMGTYAPATLSDNCNPAPLVAQSPLPGTAFTAPQTVTLTASDGNGNTSTCTFTVTVNDVAPPTLTCPPNTTVAATGPCQGTVGTYNAATLSDNCTAMPSVVQSPMPNTAFTGSRIVTLTATDGSGNTGTCTFIVSIPGSQILMTCPPLVVRNSDANTCGSVVTYPNATASDNCGMVPVTQTSGPLTSGSSFPVGVHVVVFQATNWAGTTTCSLTVTVVDGQAPTLTCPGNRLLPTATGTCAAPSTYSPSALSDNCSTNPVLSYSFSGATTMPWTAGTGSGSSFNKGTTTVTLRATDAAGLTKTCAFAVTVADLEKPVIPACTTVPPVNTAPGLCTATVSYTNPAFTDNCAPANGTTIRISGPASGSAFAAGTTNVVFRATDAAGNSRTCVLVVTVVDNQPPLITCPPPVTVTGSGSPCVSQVFYATPTVSDNCGGTLNLFLVSGLLGGSVFPAGTTVSTWRAVASNGQMAECTVSVTVECAGNRPGSAGDRTTTRADGIRRYVLSPNPASDMVQIAWTGGETSDPVHLAVFDVQGRLVWERAAGDGVQMVQVDVSDWATGVYMVALRSAGSVETKRLSVSPDRRF